MTDDRLSLSILGGFLGAGKSTWLRHRLFQQTARPIILLNDMGDVAVDEYLLERATTLKVVAGGCACCERLDEFLGVLRDICNERTQEASETRGSRTLIMETSGISQPARIARAIAQDPVLQRHLRLEQVTVVVDAQNGLGQLLADGLARTQVESADQIALSKVEDCSPADIADLISLVRRLNPTAPLRAYEFGTERALPLLPPPRRADFEFETDESPLTAVTMQVGSGPDDPSEWHAFSVFMSAVLHRHGADLVRAKGVIASPRGRLLFQSVAGHVQPLELLAGGIAENDNQVVLISRRQHPERLMKAWQTIRTL
jgi:G3E family GTPase